jgi:NAD(P)-dependent dehydrogenase (short-subunit alcohol dehydrogenase family)
VGAATVLALADRGYDVLITYRNKAARASEVAAEAMQRAVRALPVSCDITKQEDRNRLFALFAKWSDHLDVLVLNASGGLERDLVAADPQYPMHINHDAQLALLDGALPLMPRGATVIFVTSHWAHRFGEVEQFPAYTPVAASKHAGEQALRRRQDRLTDQGIRLLVVTADLIEGTITPKLLERVAPGSIEQRRDDVGALPSTTDMGEAIALSATDTTLPSGYTIVVGGPLESLRPAAGTAGHPAGRHDALKVRSTAYAVLRTGSKRTDSRPG